LQWLISGDNPGGQALRVLACGNQVGPFATVSIASKLHFPVKPKPPPINCRNKKYTCVWNEDVNIMRFYSINSNLFSLSIFSPFMHERLTAGWHIMNTISSLVGFIKA